MKYAGNITIVDDQGEAVFEHELSADEIIDVLLKRPEEPEHEEDAEPQKAKVRKCGTCSKKGHTSRKCPGVERYSADPMQGQHTEGKPCCGSLGFKHKKNCPERNVAPMPPRAELEPLDEAQYDELRYAMHDREFQSAQYSLTHKLPPREVNAAIKSKDYEGYLDGR